MKISSSLQRITQHRLSFWLLFLFAALLLLFIPLYRLVIMDGWPAGQESYFHLRLGSLLITQGIPAIDPANVVQQHYAFDPFDVFLGAGGFIIGDRFAVLLIPFCMGLGTLFFLFQLYKRLFSEPQELLFCGILTVSNPLFLQLFTHATSLSLLAFFATLGAWFFVIKKKIFISVLCFFVFFFYEIHHLIILLFLLLSLSFHFQRIAEGTKLLIFFVLGLLFVFFFRDPLLTFHSFSLYSLFQQSLSDLGAVYGISIFAFILALLGILAFRKQKKLPFATVGLLLFILFLLLFVHPSYLMYLIPFLSIAGTIGFFSLLTKEWRLAHLRNLTLLLLILGVLFSTVSFISRTATAEPTLSTIHALQWLKETSYENAVILTGYDYTSVTQYFTERRIILDPSHDPYHKTRVVERQIQQLYHTRSLEEAIRILEKYQVDFIVIFPGMFQGEIWVRQDEGLLFLVQNSENFKKVYEKDGVQIWSVTY